MNIIDKENFTQKTFYGKYRGLVVSNADPEKLGRIKCNIPEVFGHDLLTDWAYPCLPYGGISDNGFFFIPEVGSGVYVEFEAGNIDRPLWTGVWWAKKEGMRETPNLAKEKPDETTKSPKGDDSGTGAVPTKHEFSEPKSPYAARYPHNKVIKTKSGIVLEMDDTAGEERFHIWHPTGTFIEIHPDGKIVVSTQNNMYHVVNGNYDLHVKGDMNVLVDGNKTCRTVGNNEEEIDGNRKRTVVGNEDLITGGNRNYNVTGNETLEVTGTRNRSVAKDETIAIGGNKVEMIAQSNTLMTLMNSSDVVMMNRNEVTGVERTHVNMGNNIETTTMLHKEIAAVHITEAGLVIIG